VYEYEAVAIINWNENVCASEAIIIVNFNLNVYVYVDVHSDHVYVNEVKKLPTISRRPTINFLLFQEHIRGLPWVSVKKNLKIF
jgi:hypothetical protein